jgi:hypothetical protein
LKRKENIYIYIYREREREREKYHIYIIGTYILFWLCGKESTEKSRINSVEKNYKPLQFVLHEKKKKKKKKDFVTKVARGLVFYSTFFMY